MGIAFVLLFLWFILIGVVEVDKKLDNLQYRIKLMEEKLESMIDKTK